MYLRAMDRFPSQTRGHKISVDCFNNKERRRGKKIKTCEKKKQCKEQLLTTSNPPIPSDNLLKSTITSVAASDNIHPSTTKNIELSFLSHWSRLVDFPKLDETLLSYERLLSYDVQLLTSIAAMVIRLCVKFRSVCFLSFPSPFYIH